MPFRFASLQTRLSLATAVATAAVLLLAGVAVYAFVRSALLAEFDAALVSSVRSLSAMIEQSDGLVKLEPEALKIPEFLRAEQPDYFVAWTDDGKRLGGTAPATLPVPPALGRTGDVQITAETLPDGRPGRRAILRFIPAMEDERHEAGKPLRSATICYGRHTGDVDAKLTRLGWLLISIGTAATIGAALLMGLIVRRGLRPLQSLAADIAAMREQDLASRISPANAPAELTPVITRLNSLLERLQAMVERERQFTGDVAHELRTPLAGLEAMLDVSAARRRQPEEYERTVEKCRTIVRGMHAMVDNLLLLARADAKQLQFDLRDAPIGPLVDDCWSLFGDRAATSGMTVRIGTLDGLCARTDAEKLRIVLNNLFDNAISHGKPAGTICIDGFAADSVIELRIANEGSLLTEEQARAAFSRFWCGDAARHGAGRHAGLGLSLCREIIQLVGGQISARSEVGGRFEVRLVLPRATQS